MIRALKFQCVVCLSLILSGLSFAQSDVLRILPLGNSLTYGYYDGSVSDGNRIGYRKKMYDLLNSAGYNFDFVGHQYTGFLQFPDAENGGTLGIKDEQLADVMQYGYYYKYGSKVNVISPNQPYLNAYPADVILLHIGTNDWINDEIYGYQVAKLTNLFNAIDTYETSHGTEVLVLVAKIITERNVHSECTGYLTEWRVDYYNNELSNLVNARISAGDKIKLVDMQCGAGINYFSDMLNDLHPKQSGYDKMGQHWFDEIDNIHTAPVITPFSFPDAGQGESFPALDLDDYVMDDYTTDADISWTTPTPPVNYTVSVSSGHVLTVTPKDPDWIGTENITFVATDKGRYIEKLKKSSSITVTFNTIDINKTPVILSQVTAFNLNEDTNFNIVLADLEIDDDDPPANWTLNIKPGDNYSFAGSLVTPAQDYDEQLLVNVTVSDLENESDVFQVVVNINPINDAPLISGGGPLSINEDTPRTLTLSDLVYYDPDNSADELSLYVLGGSNYTVDGTTIHPAANYFGSLSVDVRIRDLALYSNTYTLTINVAPINDAPEIHSMPVTLTADNELYEYQIVATDADPGDVLEYLALAKPAWLSINSTTGLLSGTPGTHHIGIHPVTLGVSDGEVTTEQSFNLEVRHFNTPPEFITSPDTTAPLNEPYNWRVRAEDIDGDEIRFIPLEIPYFLDFLSENGYLIGTPNASNEGIHNVEIGASDGQDTTILAFRLWVGNPNFVPTILSSKGMIKVYPNPTHSVLHIKPLVQGEISSIRIFNLMGRLVFEQQDIRYAHEVISLDVFDLPEGTYVLQLFIDDSMLTHRFMIAD